MLYSRVAGDAVGLDLAVKCPQLFEVGASLRQGALEQCVSFP